MLAVLQDALIQAEVERMEIDETDGGQKRFDSSAPPSGSRDLVRAAFPLGREDRARAKVRFLFRSDEAEVRPEVSILLQLLVDGAAYALERAGSRLGPLPAEPMENKALEPLAFPTTGARA